MKIAIIRRWKKYGLNHVMCGYIDPTDFDCFTSADVTFGDGTFVTIPSNNRDDVIITDIDHTRVDEP